MGGLGLMFRRRAIQAHPTAGSDYILSASKGDAEVFRILMANGVSSDGVGISKEDAEKVGNIKTWFTGNTAIQDFDELQFFTGLTFLGNATDNYNVGAFKGCTSLRTIKIPISVSVVRNGSFMDCTKLESIGENLSGVEEIRHMAFNNCNSLNGELSFPNLLSVAHGGFTQCNMITSFSAAKLKTIGDSSDNFYFGTFYGCSNLQNVDIPSIEIVGGAAFANCAALEKIILPQCVKEIQKRAFYQCSNLKALIVNAQSPPTIGDNILQSSDKCEIYVPDASVDAYKAATKWSSYASRIKPLSEYQG